MEQVAEATQSYNDWGDVLDEDHEDDILEFTEGVDAYHFSVPPGPPCYPVSIGEIVQGNGKSYRIEHKLGHGAFSTVWLAYNIESKTTVALKIGRTLTTDSSEAEYRILQDIQHTIPNASACHLVTSSAAFSLPGETPQDSHFVMVFPILGPDLPAYFFFTGPGRGSALSTRLSIARDLLQAVACLHAHDFIHRDINEKNVMIGLRPDTLDQGPTPLERYKQVGRPQKVPLTSGWSSWRPGELVAPIDWPADLLSATAFLGDFGITIRASSAVKDNSRPPLSFCAPELLFEGHEPSFASDMWSYTCVFASLIIGFCPFLGWNYSNTLQQLVDTLGPLPQEWQGRFHSSSSSGQEMPEWYDQSKVPGDPLGALIDRRYSSLAGSRERELILDVMHKGFRYQPSDRITAQQFLTDASFLELLSIHGIS